ncbi:MAG: biopolymer transporter ExbD [Planctomycetota bacterium]
MRIRAKHDSSVVEGDLTPMIDMTFQLIAFFMLVINFSDVEQDQRVKLPASELAKPPSAPYEQPRTIHLTKDGTYIFGGKEYGRIARLKSSLALESQIIKRHTSQELADVTIVIRADGDAKTGQVQEVIQACQELEFERFALRGKQSEERTIGGG